MSLYDFDNPTAKTKRILVYPNITFAKDLSTNSLFVYESSTGLLFRSLARIINSSKIFNILNPNRYIF